MFNRGGQDAFAAGHRQNGDLLGFKFGVWEGGQRVPFIAKWPGKIPADTVSDQLFSSIDMLATFAAITGQTVDSDQLADSVNVLPALTGDPEKPVRESLILVPYRSTHVSVRKGRWMFIPKQGSGGFTGKPGMHASGGVKAASFVGSENSDFENGVMDKDAPKGQLYDLQEDVTQTTNLHDLRPDVVQEMKSLLNEYRSDKWAGKGRKKKK